MSQSHDRKNVTNQSALQSLTLSVGAIYGAILLFGAIQLADFDIRKGHVGWVTFVVFIPALTFLIGALTGFLKNRNWTAAFYLGSISVLVLISAMIPYGITTFGPALILGLVFPTLILALTAISSFRTNGGMPN